MLITLEGIDGSGKSSVWNALQAEFPEAVYTREPTDSWYGDAVRRSITDDTADPIAELFLYMADHADHVAAVVAPAIASGQTVISDRYSDSRKAYQGATLRDHIPDPIAYIDELHNPWTIPPDLTIFIDVPPEIGVERSGSTNKFEQEHYLSQVTDNYIELIAAEPDRFVRIDGTQSLQTVTETAITIVETSLM